MKLSLNQKFVLLQIPLVIVGVFVCAISWSTRESLNLQSHTQRLNQLALESRFFVAEMGSALKGFMLDPTKDSETKRKAAADANNSKAIDDMLKLATDPSMITLIKQLQELDDQKLNPAEDKVLELFAKAKYVEGRQYFLQTYLPLREQYDSLSDNLAKMSSNQSLQSTKEFETGVKDGINKIIISLIAGIFLTATLLMTTLIHVTKSLNKLKNRLSEVTSTFDRSSRDISQVSQSLAEASTETAAAIQESVSSMAEMSAMIAQTTRNTDATSILSSEVLSNSQNGAHVMAQMSQSMQAISESSGRLKEIAQVIENISEKTNVINDVVFKTQLLAVNASIEAARAGHHGKGFAVVANEVASLAAMSGRASSEIRELLRSSSTRVLEIIGGTSESIREGESACNRSIESFEIIAKSVAAISDKVGQINSASREQEAGVSQTSIALTQMNQATATTNSIAQSNAKLGHDISDQVSNLKTIDRAMNFIVTGTEAASKGSAEKQRRANRVDQILGLTSDMPHESDSPKGIITKFRKSISKNPNGTSTSQEKTRKVA